jgi:hypothetical protein
MQLRLVVCAWGAARRNRHRAATLFAAVTVATGLAGCAGSPQTTGRATLASLPPSGATLAFESIDGPPPDVFDKLVADLNNEAGARQIAVVSRTGPAVYRVRGYVSAIVDRKKTAYAWVWDVYDADKRRALRITGEETGPAQKRRDTANAWAGLDEQTARRMAKSGMDQIAAFLNAPPPAVTPAVPEQAAITLASGRDDSPEAAGIFKIFGAGENPAATQAAATETDVASPPEPAKTGTKMPAKTRSASVSSATDGRSAHQ